MAVKKKVESAEIAVLEISAGQIEVGIVGTKPIILNRMAEKAKRELLLPKGRKTAADRATTLKHDPVTEYRNSAYRHLGDARPTRLCFPAPGFKGAMMTAALDMPGAKKAEIGRLVWVDDYAVDLYGVPELLMSVVRSADMNRTPDIRTRAIIPQWACIVRLSFTKPKLNARTTFNLLAAGGITCGIGDFRQEKGKGNFGQYRVCEPDDPEIKRIMKMGGRAAQDEALANPKYHDADTDELINWYFEEVQKRSFDKGETPVDPEGDPAALDEAA